MFDSPYVKGATLGKILGVSSLDLQVRPFTKDPWDQKIAEYSEWLFTDRTSVADLVWEVFAPAMIEGYSVSEYDTQIERDGDWKGKVALDSLKSLDVGNDVALQKDPRHNVVSLMGLRFNSGKIYDIANFVYYRHLPFFNSVVGTSDFRAAFKSWFKLELVEGLRAVFLEKKALPFVVGKASAHQVPSLNDVLSRMKSQSHIVVPTNVIVDALQVAGAADVAYAAAVRDYKHDIFIGIQLASLQQLEGTITDGRGNSQVHASSADLVKFHMGSQAQKILNRINRDMIDVNFVVQHYPKLTLSSINATELLQELEIDKGLNAMGIDLSREEIYDRYGRTPPESPDDVLAGKPPGTAPAPGPLTPGASPFADAGASGVARPMPFRRAARVDR